MPRDHIARTYYAAEYRAYASKIADALIDRHPEMHQFETEGRRAIVNIVAEELAEIFGPAEETAR